MIFETFEFWDAKIEVVQLHVEVFQLIEKSILRKDVQKRKIIGRPRSQPNY